MGTAGAPTPFAPAGPKMTYPQRAEIRPTGHLSGQRGLGIETRKKCPFYKGYCEGSGSWSVTLFARLEQAREQKRVEAET